MPMMPTIRSRSSTVANSMRIRPLRRPMSTRTRVSKRSDRRSARSDSAGACGLARRWTGAFFARQRPRRRPARRAPRWPAPTGPRRRSGARAAPAAPRPPGQQRPGVAGGEHSGGDPALDRRGQVQQPDRVRDLRPAAADPPGQLLVGRAELLQQLLVGRRLFQRVQVRPVDVLQQRVPQHRVVAGVPDDRRDGVPAERLRGPPPPLAHDEFVAAVADLAGPRSAEETRPPGSRP